ncbi:MAG: flavodoxin family protein [Clostridia bacterium]|nr:flavodoxin family protein [Clostridia bacterium]
MKILAINASPNREGSTAKLIGMLLEECGKSGAECELVHIEDYSVEPCRRCKKCIKGSLCGIDDDYLHLKAKMLESDGIIIGSPYYDGKPVDGLKLFMERLNTSSVFCNLFAKKYLVGVATSAVDDCRHIAEYCATLGNIAPLSGSIVSGILCQCMVSSDGVRELQYDTELKTRIQNLAKKLISDIESSYDACNKRNKQKSGFSFLNSLRLIFSKLLRRNPAK